MTLLICYLCGITCLSERSRGIAFPSFDFEFILKTGLHTKYDWVFLSMRFAFYLKILRV